MARPPPQASRRKSDRSAEGSLLRAAHSIASTEGAAGLWSGLVPSLWLVSNPVVQFTTYDKIERVVQATLGHEADLPGLAYFVMGAAAKAVRD